MVGLHWLRVNLVCWALVELYRRSIGHLSVAALEAIERLQQQEEFWAVVVLALYVSAMKLGSLTIRAVTVSSACPSS